MSCENRGVADKLYNYLCDSVAHTGYYRLNGIELTALGPGEAELSVLTGPQHCNPMQVIHGGVYSTLVDAAMGNAIRSTGVIGVTCSMSVNFVAGAQQGELLTAKGRVTRVGRSMIYAAAELYCGEKVMATAIGSFFRTGEIDFENTMGAGHR
ncbi:MAG: PaaI family thioesterase [Syntrophomonadaceae bacterium]|nr:PaaI family thioesterase [Syntrophomonadaceae bacterium]